MDFFPKSREILNISVVATLANAAQYRMERPPVCVPFMMRQGTWQVHCLCLQRGARRTRGRIARTNGWASAVDGILKDSFFSNRPSLSFPLPWAPIPQPIPDFFKDVLWPSSLPLEKRGIVKKQPWGECGYCFFISSRRSCVSTGRE